MYYENKIEVRIPSIRYCNVHYTFNNNYIWKQILNKNSCRFWKRP